MIEEVANCRQSTLNFIPTRLGIQKKVVQRPEYPSHCVVVEEASHPPPPELPPAETLEMELSLLM